MSDDSKISTGRLARLAKLASLGARTAGDLALSRAQRALGTKEGPSDFAREKQAAQRILETLGTMKGAAMKLGQQLAMDAEALPPEARELVAKLFANAPRASFADIRGVIVAELGAPPEKLFAELEPDALASASLGQVHRARTHDGQRVAVKVQYPGVAEALKSDLQNAGLMVRALGGMAQLAAQVDPAPYYDELRREIGAETDYRREAAQTAAFAEAVSAFPELHVPRVLPELSTGRVLTTELVEGERLDVVAARELPAEERFRLGRLLVLATMGPVLTSHLSHGDPHPGNFLVRPDGRLTILDFGAVKRLSPTFVRAFWAILRRELDGTQQPLLPQFRAMGFTVHTPDAAAEASLQAVHAFAAAPVRDARYDWGSGAMSAGISAYGREHFRSLTAIQFPPEALLFYRAIGGMVNNLRTLRSEGPFREVCFELDAVRKRLHPEG